mmetsp:Transcript_7453/g.23902  ORF Transcript_7453/g.23902 Transcript_7453/m.23902 type:complete len:590 (-) Transcript_7453:116-1885(-)
MARGPTPRAHPHNPGALLHAQRAAADPADARPHPDQAALPEAVPAGGLLQHSKASPDRRRAGDARRLALPQPVRNRRARARHHARGALDFKGAQPQRCDEGRHLGERRHLRRRPPPRPGVAAHAHVVHAGPQVLVRARLDLPARDQLAPRDDHQRRVLRHPLRHLPRAASSLGHGLLRRVERALGDGRPQAAGLPPRRADGGHRALGAHPPLGHGQDPLLPRGALGRAAARLFLGALQAADALGHRLGPGDDAALPADLSRAAAPVPQALPLLHPADALAAPDPLPHHRLRRPVHGRLAGSNQGRLGHLLRPDACGHASGDAPAAQGKHAAARAVPVALLHDHLFGRRHQRHPVRVAQAVAHPLRRDLRHVWPNLPPVHLLALPRLALAHLARHRLGVGGHRPRGGEQDQGGLEPAAALQDGPRGPRAPDGPDGRLHGRHLRRGLRHRGRRLGEEDFRPRRRRVHLEGCRGVGGPQPLSAHARRRRRRPPCCDGRRRGRCKRHSERRGCGSGRAGGADYFGRARRRGRPSRVAPLDAGRWGQLPGAPVSAPFAAAPAHSNAAERAHGHDSALRRGASANTGRALGRQRE